jgi:hypothetical protein
MKRTIITIILTLAFTAFAIHAVEQKAFSGAGVIESTTGGFMFPDGSVQLTATLPPCTAITSLPYVIDESGVYCLVGNLSTDNGLIDAIKVNTDNVVIDLNGWMLDNLGAGTGTFSNGIWAYQRKNITIRNGAIRGFYTAIKLNDTSPYIVSQGHIVEGIHATQNTFLGIMVYGSNSIVRHNQVFNTGVSPNTPHGIELKGIGGRVIDNDIGDVAGGLGADTGLYISEARGVVVEGNRLEGIFGVNASYGIYIDLSDGAVVKNNRIKNVGSAGTSRGVYILNSDDSVVESNFIEGVTGRSTLRGIEINGNNHLLVNNRIQTVNEGIAMGESSTKYRDNITANVSTAFIGGTDIGGND